MIENSAVPGDALHDGTAWLPRAVTPGRGRNGPSPPKTDRTDHHAQDCDCRRCAACCRHGSAAMTWTETAIARLRRIPRAKAFQPPGDRPAPLGFEERHHRQGAPNRPAASADADQDRQSLHAQAAGATPAAGIKSPRLPSLRDRPQDPHRLPEPDRQHRVVREPALPKNSAPAVMSSKPCCWPIGTPGAPGFRFCEAPALVSKPYCPEHAKRAYARKRDRREDADLAPIRSNASAITGNRTDVE